MGSDAVVIVTGSQDAATIVSKLRAVKPNIKLVASSWSSTERLPEMAGAAAEGVLTEQYFDRGEQEFVDFKKRFKARFNSEPAGASWTAYVAARALIESGAMSKPDGASAKAALMSSFPDWTGGPRFDAFGDYFGKPALAWIRGGQFVPAQLPSAAGTGARAGAPLGR